MATPAAASTTTQTPAAQTQTGAQQSQPAKGAAVAPPTAAEVRKLKLTLDGQDVELPESEVIARAQRSTVAEKRFQEAAGMRKQAEEVLSFAKNNPKEFFKRTGMNAREWAENYLLEEINAEKMSPAEKKAAENEAKLKEYENEKKQTKEREFAEEKARMQAKHHEDYNTLFVEALGKSGLPKNAYTIRRMAELQLTNIKKKLELNADQLAKLVREDYRDEQKALFGSSDGDQLLEFLGPDLVKKLSKAQIAKIKARGLQSNSTGSAPEQRQQNTGGLTWKEYQRRNRKLS